MSDVATPTGALATLDGRRRPVFRRVLADPVDAVWSAMTESDRLGRHRYLDRLVASLRGAPMPYAGLGGLYPDA
jgi:hypothetical protein